MKFLKLSLAAVFAIAMTAGALMAADEPLEIHGGGRIGFVVNSMLGSDGSPTGDNRMGRYPNHGETNYYCLWFSKKVTAEGGAWSKVTFGIDNWNGTPNGDLAGAAWRLRGMNTEFGGLDFLPEGSTVKAGLFGLSIGWNDAQDFGPGPNFSGIGIGLANLGGLVGLYYMANDSSNDSSAPKLGTRTMHTIVATVSNPMVDVIAGFGYAKKGDKVAVAATADTYELDPDTGLIVLVPGDPAYETEDKNLTAVAIGAIVKLPVAGLNVFAQMGTNNFAIQMENAFADDTVLKGTSFDAGIDADGQAKAYQCTLIKVGLYTIMDVAEGLNVAPAMFYQSFKTGKDFDGSLFPDWAGAKAADTAYTRIDATVRISKALTKNLAFVPALGYARTSTDAAGDKPATTIQVTAGLCMALDTGYWAGQKIQVYGSFVNVDKDHKTSAEWDDKTNRMYFGTYVTFGF